MTPAIVVVILLGAFWPRYTPQAAFWTLIGGMALIFLSFKYPVLIKPFSHGVPGDDGYAFMRAFFGFVVSTAIGVTVTLFTKPRPEESVCGLVYSSVRDAMLKFKGGEPSDDYGKKVRVLLQTVTAGEQTDHVIRLSLADMKKMKAQTGDMVNISDHRWWTGGLASANVFLGEPHEHEGLVLVNGDLLSAENLPANGPLVVEKIL